MGIIGGSGLYELEDLIGVREISVPTPYGSPSDALITGTLAGVGVAFLPRHGRTHHITPSRLPARANLYALKSLGARQVISVSAVGSLREDYRPGDLVVPDQIVDRTRSRGAASFFDGDVVVHVPFGDPYCARLRTRLAAAVRTASTARVHERGTYCCMEGPQFSTRAESELYRSWGMDVIGMTALPEAKLAREAELCYAGLSLVTDYDCWRDGYDDVSAHSVTQVMKQNSVAAKAALVALLESLDPYEECHCHGVLADSVITPASEIRARLREGDELLLSKYL
ncbi:S-methyl-5'-thioadenosine phosphorylase [Streptomyces sp. G45]|uniref:S-methyl-5'-thioadenosine phosphorylase n=1 Tax=Streptomyces sp. G45 TaxID=3406627 RepID=UPI003C1758BA